MTRCAFKGGGRCCCTYGFTNPSRFTNGGKESSGMVWHIPWFITKLRGSSVLFVVPYFVAANRVAFSTENKMHMQHTLASENNFQITAEKAVPLNSASERTILAWNFARRNSMSIFYRASTHFNRKKMLFILVAGADWSYTLAGKGYGEEGGSCFFTDILKLAVANKWRQQRCCYNVTALSCSIIRILCFDGNCLSGHPSIQPPEPFRRQPSSLRHQPIRHQPLSLLL